MTLNTFSETKSKTQAFFGLIGHPLGHSYSKVYFTKKFEDNCLNYEYQNYDIEDVAEIRQLILDHPGLKGFNVTIPYKEAIIPYLDETDPVAAEIGAVNTVKVLPDRRLKGFNTDVIGLIKTDCFVHPPHQDITALILGTGGVSKAVQYVLKKNKIPYHLVSRDPLKGNFIYQDLTPEVIQSHLLIINATPLGMAPHVDSMPQLPYESITPQHILFDLIYNPDETRFLKRGREHGASIFNGLAMLHAQAEASWDIWNKEEKQ